MEEKNDDGIDADHDDDDDDDEGPFDDSTDLTDTLLVLMEEKLAFASTSLNLVDSVYSKNAIEKFANQCKSNVDEKLEVIEKAGVQVPTLLNSISDMTGIDLYQIERTYNIPIRRTTEKILTDLGIECKDYLELPSSVVSSSPPVSVRTNDQSTSTELERFRWTFATSFLFTILSGALSTPNRNVEVTTNTEQPIGHDDVVHDHASGGEGLDRKQQQLQLKKLRRLVEDMTSTSKPNNEIPTEHCEDMVAMENIELILEEDDDDTRKLELSTREKKEEDLREEPDANTHSTSQDRVDASTTKKNDKTRLANSHDTEKVPFTGSRKKKEKKTKAKKNRFSNFLRRNQKMKPDQSEKHESGRSQDNNDDDMRFSFRISSGKKRFPSYTVKTNSVVDLETQ